MIGPRTGEERHPGLREALSAPGALRWRLVGDEDTGAAVLGFAQGGVVLVLPDSEVMVPADVWTGWVAAMARRAVEAWSAGPGAPEPPSWIAASLNFMDNIPAADASRQDVLLFAASANPMRHIQSGDRDVAEVCALVWDTWGWTYRRAFGDRRQRDAPHTLATAAVAAHRALALRAGEDAEAAEDAERTTLYADLLQRLADALR